MNENIVIQEPEEDELLFCGGCQESLRDNECLYRLKSEGKKAGRCANCFLDSHTMHLVKDDLWKQKNSFCPNCNAALVVSVRIIKMPEESIKMRKEFAKKLQKQLDLGD